MKRVISIMLVLTMLMSLNTSAFAAVRPANATATSVLADVFSDSTEDNADIESATGMEDDATIEDVTDTGDKTDVKDATDTDNDTDIEDATDTDDETDVEDTTDAGDDADIEDATDTDDEADVEDATDTDDEANIEDVGDPEEANVFDEETHDSQMMKKQIATIAEYESTKMIGNDYIQFCVADVDNTENSGRFTIGNTGGNPNYVSDDNEILLFGHPSPWSSYTTIRIDSRNYIFMADHTTYDTENLRAVSTMTAEDILVTQTLQIVENEGTGLLDTVQITYTAENQSNRSKNVAIRIMLDTMLGYNDGAPFKVPSLGNVTLERELSGNAIPAFWQAFDSLDDASVFAIGTLYKGGDRRPDKVQYTAWGNVYMSEHAWNYTIDPTNLVTYDSAVSIYWNSTAIAANSSTTVSTYYGVGYSDRGEGSTEAFVEIPSNGFSVMVLNEDGSPVPGASVTTQNAPFGPDTKTTGENGIAVFNHVPSNGANAAISISKTGYQLLNVTRPVQKGHSIAVTLYPDDGNVRITAVTGTIDGNSVDILHDYKYFKANSGDSTEAGDKSNVKNFVISVEASSSSISKYQLLQGGSIVAESTTSTIELPVLTGTPTDPTSFGMDWRITKLKAGEVVYLRVVDTDGTVSERKALGIRVSEPTLYGGGDGKGNINFGKKLKITVPSNIPIIGDSEIELGWNGLPFIFEVSQSGKVKFAINPKANPLNTGSVDGTNLSNWDEVKKEYDDAMEDVTFGRSSAAKAFGGTPQSFGAGKLSVDASIMGYGEGYIDNNGNIIVDVGIIITISEQGSYTQTFFLGYVPVYVSVGEKVSVSGKGEVSIVRTNGNWNVSGAVGEINPKITLNVDGGVGANGVLNIGASGRGTLSWLNRWTDNYNRVDLTGEMYLVAQAFLFKAEKKLASGTWTIYDSYSRAASIPQMFGLNRDFYDTEAYSPISRDYLNVPSMLTASSEIVKANVYPDATPKLVKVGDTAYLFWLDDVAERADDDRTALVYATSTDLETWTPAQRVDSASNEADYAYDVAVSGTDIHIAISRANKAFGTNGTTSMDSMAASSEIYYTKLATGSGNSATTPVRVTTDTYADTMPSVMSNSGKVQIAWAKNDLRGGLFGTNNTFTVCYADVSSGSVTSVEHISVNGPVLAVATGMLGTQAVVSYIVDTDKDYNTSDDAQLWISGRSMPISEGAASPTFAQVDSANTLLWYSSGNIGYVTAVDSTVCYVFDDDNMPNTLNCGFSVVEGTETMVIWSAMAQNEALDTVDVYASAYDASTGKWSNGYLLFNTESELTSVLSGCTLSGKDGVAYLKTSNVGATSPATNLCVENVVPKTELALRDIYYDMSKVEPGKSLPITLTIENCGGATVSAISLSINGTAVSISDAGLKRGETKEYLVSFTVPANLAEVTEYTITIEDAGNSSDNSLSFNIGYADASVSASGILVNGEDWVSIAASNESAFTSDVTLRVIADEKDGAVLYEQTLENMTVGTTQNVLLNLNSLGANVDVFYITVTPDRAEVRTSNNTDLIYLGLGNTQKYSIQISATEGGEIIGISGGLYERAETIAIAAAAEDGYEFIGWTSSGGGSFDNANNLNTTFTVPANDVTITANFRRTDNQPPINPDPITPSNPNTPSRPGGSSSSGGGSVNTTYSVSVPSRVTGGSVTVRPRNAAKGNTVTITVTPDEGYELDKLTVTDKDGNELRLTDEGGGKYTFTMPGSRVDVEATFREIGTVPSQPNTPTRPGTSTPHPFTDVPADEWYAEAVQYVYDLGMMNGMTPTTFEPATNMNRGMIVTMLYRLEGEPSVGMSSFTDVPTGQWYSNAVAWAEANGIVNGMTPTTFEPLGLITRQQMAAILYRYASYKGYDVGARANLSSYTDAGQVATYALTAMQWANAEGLITGTTPVTLDSTGNATRAQVAMILMRFCENVAQ